MRVSTIVPTARIRKAEPKFLAAAFQRGTWAQSTIGARCSSLVSEQRELSSVRNPCDDLTGRKSSKIGNWGAQAYVRHGGLRLGRPASTTERESPRHRKPRKGSRAAPARERGMRRKRRQAAALHKGSGISMQKGDEKSSHRTIVLYRLVAAG
jgi:hypothetical protein